MSWNRPGCEKQPAPAKRGRGAVVAIAAAGILLALAAVALWYMSSLPTHSVTEAGVNKQKLIRERPPDLRSPKEIMRETLKKHHVQRKPKKHMRISGDIFAHLKGADKRHAEALQEALDAEDFKGTCEAAEVALKSDTPEVRQQAVEALGWFGAEALPELTPLMSDPDENVRQVAGNAWEGALAELEGNEEKFTIATTAMSVLTDDDALSSIGGHVSSSALDLIDGASDESKSAQYRQEILQALVDIIEGRARNASEAAKEVYNDITGHAWINVDEAEAYLQDPENYEEP